ncbi:hypothetical protein KFE98_02850 [bacterium SCSIO 12741]|nr:hypothetical protein KFE98_02850 [bacterium SCSIO 12741]
MKKITRTILALLCICASQLHAQHGIYNRADILDTLLTDYLADTNLNYLRPVGVAPNGIIQLLDPKTVTTYRITDASEILSMNLAENSILYTHLGGSYVVSNDSLNGFAVDSCAVVPTANGKYAILQIRDQGYYIEDFGAIPGDNLDDSKAIQKCIDAAIQLQASSRVNAGAGIFYLDKGVVLARELKDSNGDPDEYSFVGFTISGIQSPYDASQELASSTVFWLRDSSFCLAVQEARNAVIENIVFYGDAMAYESMSLKKWVENTLNDWGAVAGARTNRYSPSCAIAIDPFHQAITGTNRYPGHENRYHNTQQGGTSMLLIKNCVFRDHFVAIANNPSPGVQNGDNIRAEHCHVKFCHTFWAAGQTQSRGNSIDNIYSTLINRFVDCELIGTGVGTPPGISNCNIAGFTKEFIHMTQTGRSPVRATNVYIESLFSLGYINANHVSFNQCHFKFMNPEDGDGIFTPPYHLYSSNTATFTNCALEFYTDGSRQMPFRFNTAGLSIVGGNIQGGLIVNGPWGTESALKINYDNVALTGQGQVIGGRHNGGSYFHLSEKYLLGGDEIHNQYWADQTFKNDDKLYNIYPRRLDSNKRHIWIDSNETRAYFIASDPGLYRLEDNLLAGVSGTSGTIDGSAADMTTLGMPSHAYTHALGFVSEISEDTIFISGTPYGLQPGPMFIYHVEYPVFYLPMWGDLEAGNDTITNVDMGSLSLLLTGTNYNGRRLYGEGIEDGAYIVSVDRNNQRIVMSTAANATKTHEYLYNAKYSQTVKRDDPFPSGGPTEPIGYKEGCQILLNSISPSVYGYVVSSGGVIGSTVAPSFGALTY